MIDNATIAVLLTAGGAPIASAVIAGIIEFFKASPLTRFVDGREKTLAIVLTIVVVLYAYLAGLTSEPPTQHLTLIGILVVPLAIYNIGRLAMAVHDDVNRKPNSLTA